MKDCLSLDIRKDYTSGDHPGRMQFIKGGKVTKKASVKDWNASLLI